MPSAITIIAAVLLLFLAAGFFGWLVSLYNSLVQVRNNMGKAWENIDVLLIQRNEELPKVIAIVKLYAGHEQDLLHSLTALRLAYANARNTAAGTNIENQLRQRLQALAGLGERYPDLKANQPFAQLMARVAAIEDGVADRRTFFNETVNIYNTQIGLFPQMIFAGLLNYERQPYLKEIPGDHAPEGP